MKAASVRSLWRWCVLGGLAGAAAVGMAFGCRQADSSAANLPEVKSTVESNTAFAVDLYQRLKDQPGNLFFSPYSLSTALAMAYAGARGQRKRRWPGRFVSACRQKTCTSGSVHWP